MSHVHYHFIARFLFTFCATFLLSTHSYAKVVELDAINISSDVGNWVEGYAVRISQQRKAEKDLPYVECRPVAEIKSVYYCLYPTRGYTNAAFVRASTFVEGIGGAEPRNHYSFASPSILNAFFLIGGHDLRAQDMQEFYEASQELCNAKISEMCLSPFEKEIYESFLIPHIQRDKNFVVLVNGIDGEDWAPYVAHEIMHGQYFNDLTYRQVVDEFWQKSLSDDEKIKIRNILRGYNAQDEFLMKLLIRLNTLTVFSA